MTTNPPATRERLLTVRDVAEAFQMSRPHVRALALSGDLPGMKLGHNWRFRAATVDAWARAQEAAAIAQEVVEP